MEGARARRQGVSKKPSTQLSKQMVPLTDQQKLIIIPFICTIPTRSTFCVNFSTNVVMNYTEIEAKVREATNDEAWGPTGQIMQELAHSTFTYEHFPEVMSMLWKRMLQDNKQNWRRTYKVWYSFPSIYSLCNRD